MGAERLFRVQGGQVHSFPEAQVQVGLPTAGQGLCLLSMRDNKSAAMGTEAREGFLGVGCFWGRWHGFCAALGPQPGWHVEQAHSLALQAVSCSPVSCSCLSRDKTRIIDVIKYAWGPRWLAWWAGPRSHHNFSAG
jgi:hypothetical protein